MTQNQIRYQEHLEDVRHNLASEAEISRNNRAILHETNRHNVVYEKETNRHNLAQESLSHETNIINRNHYQAMDSESARHNKTNEEEAKRHNMQMEISDALKAQASWQTAKNAAELGMINANTEYYKATLKEQEVGIAQQNADSQRWKYFHDYVNADYNNYLNQSLNEYKKSEIQSYVDLNQEKTKTEKSTQWRNYTTVAKDLFKIVDDYILTMDDKISDIITAAGMLLG